MISQVQKTLDSLTPSVLGNIFTLRFVYD
ncbi:hypothetical protein E2C01_076703 [Portunus trituberculatus]|uniref:Uncharacterized protein n=1 Tax=Portunus trituberculatus TaxID=210409 RepID=A0A5B7IKC5_PORTR|nr:hypothetical protein [Portunus trituberculatus]